MEYFSKKQTMFISKREFFKYSMNAPLFFAGEPLTADDGVTVLTADDGVTPLTTGEITLVNRTRRGIGRGILRGV